MTQVFNEVSAVMTSAIKRGETPGDIITALTSCVIGVINCLKVAPDIKVKLGKSAADMIAGEIKS